MREGDVYFWRWSDPEKDVDKHYGAYHCYSRIAVFHEGKLRDTYWCNWEKVLDPAQVVAKLQGNLNDMTVLKDNEHFYRSQDLVDMRHPNNTNGDVMLRKGATRDRFAMIEYIQMKYRDHEQEIEMLTRRMGSCIEALQMIDRGELDKVVI